MIRFSHEANSWVHHWNNGVFMGASLISPQDARNLVDKGIQIVIDKPEHW